MKKQLPLVNLHRHQAPLTAEFISALENAIETGDFILGQSVSKFEEEFARFCGVSHAIGVSSGTSALELALRGLGIGASDEVITTAQSFFATAAAVVYVGARPIFVDVEEKTGLMNLDQIQKAISPRTKALIPVHLYGAPIDMEAVSAISKKNNLFVVEDACQAHGAVMGDRKAGAWGNAGCFSFYPSKNLGALGDGGIVTTNDSALADRIKILRNCGRISKYDHEVMGYNKRLDSLQAAFLQIKLKKLNGWNKQRQKTAQQYDRALKGLPIRHFEYDSKRPSIYHLYVIQTPQRDALRDYLHSKKIDTGIHYPIPLPHLKSFANLGYQQGQFPVAEKMSREVLSLPIFPGMTSKEVDYIAACVHDFFKGSRSS